MLTAEEMQELERRAFAAGASADELMEKVGRAMAEEILRCYPKSSRVVGFLGKGHNAGDALVAMRYLSEAGWECKVRAAFPVEEWAKLTREKFDLLATVDEWLVRSSEPLVLLDGLIGIGGRGRLREPLRSLAKEMNTLRQQQGAVTVAMDLPSGFNADTGDGGEVIADRTLTVGVVKKGLVADAATSFVGALHLIELNELPTPEQADQVTTRLSLKELFPPRPFDFHKGQAGRVALVAGSEEYLGAAVLAASGALRAGAGLITLWAERAMISGLRGMLPPEVMVRPRPERWFEFLEHRHDALVVGPGLGDGISEKLFELLAKAHGPRVLDADALNAIARHQRLDLLTKETVLTPHPGEMARLFPYEGSRAEWARRFVKEVPAVLLLKGARTIVTEAQQMLHYNTTGTPGMAVGGMGDVLSGVIGAFLAGGMKPLDAARAGAWVCGRAGEVAERSPESLKPTDVTRFLGEVLREIRIG